MGGGSKRQQMKIDAVDQGLAGIRKGHERLARSAERVATMATAERPDLDLAHEVVEQILARVESQASARVVETALELDEHLIDLFA